MSTNEAAMAAVQRVLSADEHVRWAYVFGSVARGTAWRDVDVAVMFRDSSLVGGTAFGNLVARLEEVVGASVDLVDLAQAELPFVGPMLRERRVIVDNEPQARRTWEAEITSRWLDFEPSYDEFLRRRTEAMRLRLQRGR